MPEASWVDICARIPSVLCQDLREVELETEGGLSNADPVITRCASESLMELHSLFQRQAHRTTGKIHADCAPPQLAEFHDRRYLLPLLAVYLLGLFTPAGPLKRRRDGQGGRM